jgi:hypothetical protein
MIEVIVFALEGNGEKRVGKFRFAALPRKGDEITVPWADDPYGIRCFNVDEVCHTAADVVDAADGDAPYTILKGREIP